MPSYSSYYIWYPSPYTYFLFLPFFSFSAYQLQILSSLSASANSSNAFALALLLLHNLTIHCYKHPGAFVKIKLHFLVEFFPSSNFVCFRLQTVSYKNSFVDYILYLDTFRTKILNSVLHKYNAL